MGAAGGLIERYEATFRRRRLVAAAEEWDLSSRNPTTSRPSRLEEFEPWLTASALQ
jgi:hypothetical protein